MKEQRCMVPGCNAVLKPLVPHSQGVQQKVRAASSELYCPECNLSYSKHSQKLRKVLPHIAKEFDNS